MSKVKFGSDLQANIKGNILVYKQMVSMAERVFSGLKAMVVNGKVCSGLQANGVNGRSGTS